MNNTSTLQCHTRYLVHIHLLLTLFIFLSISLSACKYTEKVVLPPPSSHSLPRKQLLESIQFSRPIGSYICSNGSVRLVSEAMRREEKRRTCDGEGIESDSCTSLLACPALHTQIQVYGCVLPHPLAKPIILIDRLITLILHALPVFYYTSPPPVAQCGRREEGLGGRVLVERVKGGEKGGGGGGGATGIVRT